MKKLALCVSLFAASAFAGDMVGYISDATCGESNANDTAASAECARTCVRNGADPVFVTAADKKTYRLADKKKVMEMVGKKVVVSGTVKGDVIEIASIKPAK